MFVMGHPSSNTGIEGSQVKTVRKARGGIWTYHGPRLAWTSPIQYREVW
jgi:lipoate-protein ligase B